MFFFYLVQPIDCKYKTKDKTENKPQKDITDRLTTKQKATGKNN